MWYFPAFFAPCRMLGVFQNLREEIIIIHTWGSLGARMYISVKRNLCDFTNVWHALWTNSTCTTMLGQLLGSGGKYGTIFGGIMHIAIQQSSTCNWMLNFFTLLLLKLKAKLQFFPLQMKSSPSLKLHSYSCLPFWSFSVKLENKLDRMDVKSETTLMAWADQTGYQVPYWKWLVNDHVLLSVKIIQ